MRILMVSNLYPPFYQGGYEIACKQLTDALRMRGHQVRVLTSTYGVERPMAQGDILRHLRILIDPHRMRREILFKELANRYRFAHACRYYKPDIVFIWNLTHVSASLSHAAMNRNIPVCYYVFDRWFENWDADHWNSMRRSVSAIDRILVALGILLGLPTTDAIPCIGNAIFASQYLKNMALEHGLPVERNPVLRWGVDTERFAIKIEKETSPIRLLYVGQIAKHKGVHTVLQAMGILLSEKGKKDRYLLTITGDERQFPDYTAELKDIVRDLGIGEAVTFTGKVEHKSLPALYSDHDILVFPSIWDEPYGMVLVEAMASGLAIVSTATGGSAELIRDNETGLVFNRDDPSSCASQIRRLSDHRQLLMKLRIAARSAAEEMLRFDRTVDSVEAYLQAAVERR